MGGITAMFHELLAVGDVICSEATCVEIVERESRSGPVVLATSETIFSRQDRVRTTAINQMSRMTAPERRGPVFEKVAVGEVISPLSARTDDPGALMCWSAAIENWHRIHDDEPFAVGHERLPRPARQRLLEATLR